MKKFEKDLERLINRHSLENESGTPDYILARYLVRCLDAFNMATKHRTWWFRPECEIDAPCPENRDSEYET